MSNAAAPDFQKPGFYLLDDADGRFVVDQHTGVVMLSDEAILVHEHGDIHHAQLRVVEGSGHSYTLDLALRLTGRIPQMAGLEDLLDEFGVTRDAPERLTYDAYLETDDDFDDDQEIVRIVSWAGFTATKGYIKPLLGSEHAPFGTLIELWVPSFNAGFAGLTMVDDVPAPQSRTAIWSV